ncbi:LamG-like jellyroll fold domain-containing protein [Nocardiopsis dassonvillei]|uniref:LamG-like jellyroll fold domain-containing protein n=1 Tax=Nocardiopsis dassonvillei TaxID=2014 RepID=UPI00157C83A0|nr:LamG-like jellyroll fold domain-containing protein [Nocardiopsis dassonvillei]
MLSPLTRVAAVTTAATLALSLLTAVPAAADDDESTSPSSEGTQSGNEEFDALALAEQTGEPVEIPSLTDEKTQHFANPDGTFTAEVSAIPVRVRSGEGWVDVDTTLVAGDDGLVRPRAAGMDIAFSGGGDAPMARIGIGSNSVALDWVADLPTPTLDGDQATYADVLPDVDLVLTAGVEGFTQVLVVHTPEAAASPELAELELPLDATGVSVVADEHGNIEAIGDEGGQSVFTAQAPAMWDSTGQDEAAGENPLLAPTTGARTALVETEVKVESIRLVPDKGMLTDETTEYPVYIDPSVSASRPNWAYVDRFRPDQEYYNKKIDSVGLGRYSDPTGTYTRRAFFQFSVPGRIKQDTTTIHSATMRAEVDWAHSCNSDSYVQLHRTDRFNSNTTWNNQPTARTLLDTQNVKGGWATCPASSGVEFDATAAYQWGADNDQSYVYLRLKERDESSNSAWRRIDIDGKPPVLVIDYNNKPSQVATSTMSDSLGGVCSTDQDNPRLINNTTVTFHATVRDYDARAAWGGQKLKLRVEWRVNGTEPREYADSAYSGVGYWPNGSQRSVTATGLPEGELLGYRAIAHDETEWGYPWSDWCWIKIDTTQPESGPDVTSTDYPAGDTAHGTVGGTGDFTFTNNGFEDAAAYHYSVNDASCSTVIDLEEPGATVTVPITPPRSGPNLIHARIVDAYGNTSPCGLAYMFMVAPIADPVSYFPLDEGEGSTAADLMDRGRTAVATGELAWTRGRLGQTVGDSYRLEGAAVETNDGSHLRTEGPVVDTGDAFSVSAWVRLDEGTANHTAVSQDGERHSGFYLGYDHNVGGKWVFKQAPFDGDDTGITNRVYSTAPAEMGAWTHLLGTHDPETGELVLYVNGVRQGGATQETPWNAQGPLVIGGAKYKGQFYDAWPGAVDDVRVWDRVIMDEALTEDEGARSEVWELANRPIALEGRWLLDETGGTTVADSSDHGIEGTLHGDPLTAWNEAVNDITRAPGVSLNSTEAEHIRTTGPAVRTDRSLSVAAWVRLDESGANSTAVSQDGNRHSGFYLGYNTNPEENWVFKQAPYDGDGTQIDHRAFSRASAEFGRWTHLVGTYDHTTGELTLYVDGVRQSSVVQESPWNAFGEVVIGAAKYRGELYDAWGGDISDVHLYQGVLSEDDINLISMGSLPTI